MTFLLEPQRLYVKLNHQCIVLNNVLLNFQSVNPHRLQMWQMHVTQPTGSNLNHTNLCCIRNVGTMRKMMVQEALWTSVGVKIKRFFLYSLIISLPHWTDILTSVIRLETVGLFAVPSAAVVLKGQLPVSTNLAICRSKDMRCWLKAY